MRIFALLALAAFILHAADPAPETQPRVAKLDFSELQEELSDRLLAKPENGTLKQELEAQEKAEAVRNKAMQQAHAEGKDLALALKDLPDVDHKPRQRLERLIKSEILRFLVKRYKNRFAVILDASQFGEESIVYLDGEVVDITQAVKQALQLNEF